MSGVSAVSYTHLDVYKRQGVDGHSVVRGTVAEIDANFDGFSWLQHAGSVQATEDSTATRDVRRGRASEHIGKQRAAPNRNQTKDETSKGIERSEKEGSRANRGQRLPFIS